MEFADLHSHILPGVDDGPRTRAESEAMLDAAYAGGVRTLCLTPHFHPGYFGDNAQKSREAFALLREYAARRYPELKLHLGNELCYGLDAPQWLADGLCRTLADTDFVLVDFFEKESERNILRGLERLLAAGYRPILAHAERYAGLSVNALRSITGVLVQLDSLSLTGGFGLAARLRAHALLKADLVDLAASDGHDLTRRPPTLSRAYTITLKKYGSARADALFRDTPLALLQTHSQEGLDDCHE